MSHSQARGDVVRASTQLCLALALSSLLAACHAEPNAPQASANPDDSQVDDPASGPTATLLAPTLFTVASYDGSGQMVHPDAVVFPHSWKGSRYWFAVTPYPGGNASFENPSAYVGSDPAEWKTAPGVTNPLARPDDGAYLSDPDLSFDPSSNELRLYYRQTKSDVDQIYLKTSRNGADWSVPVLVVQDERYDLISPAVVREQDGTWRMWTVGAHVGGCRSEASQLTLSQRHSRDGFTWTAAEPVNLTIPHSVPWHWDVQYIKAKKEYWALVAAFPNGSNCSRTAVYFARSADGTNWSVSPTPLMAAGELDALQDLVYRSTFRYFANDDLVMVWFSGARLEGESFHYSLATARYPLADLLQRVDKPLSASASRMPHDSFDPQATQRSAARMAFIEKFP
jgi:hypothetical protein